MLIPWYYKQPCKNGHNWQWASSTTDKRENPPSGLSCQCGAYLWIDDDEKVLTPETTQAPPNNPNKVDLESGAVIEDTGPTIN